MGEWPEFFLLGVPLLALGVGLFAWQRRVDAAAVPEDDVEARLLAGRSRRRTQVAILIGIVGLLMVGCGVVDPRDYPGVWWAGVLLILVFGLWIGALGLADLAASRATLGRRLAEVSMQRAAIERELKRIREDEGR